MMGIYVWVLEGTGTVGNVIVREQRKYVYFIQKGVGQELARGEASYADVKESGLSRESRKNKALKLTEVAGGTRKYVSFWNSGEERT